MKSIGVTGLIRSNGKHSFHLLLGRRGKDPNRGLYVLPGGGVEDGESLEEGFLREIKEETGLTIIPDLDRWKYPTEIIELPHRIILVAYANVQVDSDLNDHPTDGGDLYDVAWFNLRYLPNDISPMVLPVLKSQGLI